MLVILLGVSALVAGLYYEARLSTNPVSPTCTNGATNYPSCNNNTCTNGATNYPACNNNVCTNGATNYPACSICPSGQTLAGGQCYQNCTNGATNPPACNNNTCSNGATNYPTCSIFATATTLTCIPSTVHVNLTQSTCTATVSDTTIPTGTVGISCTGRPGRTYGDCNAPNTCSLSGVSIDASSCVFTVMATGPETSEVIYANYQGDSTHTSSSGQFILTVIPPPSTVTVTGTASTTGLGTTAYKIDFTDTVSGLTYSAAVNSNSYTITLTNFRTYNVFIDWNGALGSSGTCSAGTLHLQSYADTWTANYQC